VLLTVGVGVGAGGEVGVTSGVAVAVGSTGVAVAPPAQQLAGVAVSVAVGSAVVTTSEDESLLVGEAAARWVGDAGPELAPPICKIERLESVRVTQITSRPALTQISAHLPIEMRRAGRMSDAPTFADD